MRILYLDDERIVARAIANLLRDSCAVATVPTADDALSLLPYGHWDVVMSDFSMPGRDGVDFMREVARLLPSARRVLVTGNPNHPKVRAAVKEGTIEKAFGKPVPIDNLRELLGLPPRKR